MKTQAEVIFSDLPSLVVGGFKSARGQGRGWVAVDYTTEAFGGRGIATGHGSGARPLVLRLGLQGRHTLYLGVNSYSALRVWLDGEPGFREFVCGHGGHQFLDIRLHAADLTGRRLHIAPVPALRDGQIDGHLFLGYVRAVRADHAPTRSARNLVATNDGFSWIALDGMATLRDVTKQFAPYRDSDFFRMLWCPTGADVSGNHRTKVGTVAPLDTTHASRRCDRLFADTRRRILRGRGDILRAAVAAAREVGLEIQFYIRPEAFYAPFPYDGVFTSRFLERHPEWRCRDEHGREVRRMSYAFPAVQDHLLAYVDELLAYQPDGICVAFNRSLPLMICEPPVLEAFRARHGRAPRLPAEVDAPELLAVRQELLAGFMARLHGALRARGKTLSAIVGPSEDQNRLFGLDLESLVARRDLEAVYVTGWCGDSAWWQRLRRTYPVRIFPTIHYAHEGNAAAAKPFDHQWQASALQKVLDAGFAGTFWWDTETMHHNPYNWHVLRHGGSPAFLQRVLADDPPVRPVFRKVTSVRGVRLDRYNPMSSY